MNNLTDIGNYKSNEISELISNLLINFDWKNAEEIFTKYKNSIPPIDINKLYEQIQAIKYRIIDSNSLKLIPFSLKIKLKSFELRFLLDIEQYTQRILWSCLIYNQIYEKETLQIICELLNPGDCFLDIGAHVGYFSLISSGLVGGKGKVVTVEPDKSNYNHLLKHIEINGIKNVYPINAVLGHKEDEVIFYINSDNDGGHALWEIGLHPQNEISRNSQIIEQVQMLTIDSIFKKYQLEKVKVIKIDTEGAELQVLKGGINSLSSDKINFIICEINRFGLHQMGNNEQKLRGFMYNLGFDSYLIIDQDPMVLPLKPEQYVDSNEVFNILFSKHKLS